MKEVVGKDRYGLFMREGETPGLAPLVAEYDENGNLVAKYHHHGGGLMAMTRNNSSYWYSFEAIGTVRQLMDGQGQVSDAYTFDAWGNEPTSPQSQVPNPFKYVGKHGYYLDTESALMLLGVRYYGAANGLFLSRDLIEGYGYTYSGNNPLRWIDPRGLQSIAQQCVTIGGQTECYSQYQPPCPIHPPSWGCGGYHEPPPPPRRRWICDKYSQDWIDRRIGCINVKAPKDLPWPPKTKDDIFCWGDILDKAMGLRNEMCIYKMHGVLITLYGFLQAGFNDKFVHCLAGCLATRLVDCECATWLSIWFEIQPLGGVVDPKDVLATLDGMDCAHDFRRCKNFPQDCSRCCGRRYPS